MPHMDFKNKVLRRRDSSIYIIQELDSVGYRMPEKKVFCLFILAGD